MYAAKYRSHRKRLLKVGQQRESRWCVSFTSFWKCRPQDRKLINNTEENKIERVNERKNTRLQICGFQIDLSYLLQVLLCVKTQWYSYSHWLNQKKYLCITAVCKNHLPSQTHSADDYPGAVNVLLSIVLYNKIH